MTGPTCARRLVALLAALALAGCGGEAATKAGGGAAPLTLTIGTDDFPGRPATDQIEQFARDVDELSAGRLVIKPVWHAAGDTGRDDYDQKVARLVVAGRLDLGMIPARAWDTEGVTSLRALHAPFLITSDELAAEVATSEVAATMLAGLETVGVTGLALLPEGLRHVFSFGDPLLTVADFRGVLIGVPASQTAYVTFTALGATADDVTADEAAVAAGRVAATESSFVLAPNLSKPTTGVGNVTLYPKFNSLVLNSAVSKGLPADLRQVLRDAAVRTQHWAFQNLPSEADAAAAFCRSGGHVVNTDEGNVAAFRRAVQPVYTELEADPTTRRLINQIRALQRSTGAAPESSKPCGPEAGASPSGSASSVPEFPEGVYRAEVPLEAFRELGVNDFDANNHAGVWTLTFAEDRLTINDVNSVTGQEHTESGTYCLADGRIGLGITPFARSGSDSPCDPFWDARWTVQGDELRFVDIRGQDGPTLLMSAIFGSRPFTRIG